MGLRKEECLPLQHLTLTQNVAPWLILLKGKAYVVLCCSLQVVTSLGRTAVAVNHFLDAKEGRGNVSASKE